MIKKVLFAVLAMSLLLTGCGEQTDANQEQAAVSSWVESQQSATELSLVGFTLGMTPNQMLEQLDELSLQIEVPDYSQVPLPSDVANAVEDGRTYNMTDLSFYYKLKDYDTYFNFSSEGKLVTVSNRDANIVFDNGLKIGSSLDTAKDIFGRGYTENPEDICVLQYNTDKGYLNIFYEDSTVIGWSLSEYSNIYND